METFLDIDPEAVEEAFAAFSLPAFRARQVRLNVYRRFQLHYEAMTDLPKELRRRLAAELPVTKARLLTEQRSPDGTVKGLLAFPDLGTAEVVLLPYRYGHSVCISSQVGCRQVCRFCATGASGFTRSLTAGEMMAEYLYACRALGRLVSHIVLMGSGEPLDNYEAVLTFLRRLHSPATVGLSYRRMTISTVGLVPEIYRLAGEGLPLNLALSLHATTDEVRSALIPENRRYPIHEILTAVDHYRQATGRRITYEYLLIDGVNDSPADAARLAALVRAHPGHVNLIPLNPVPEFPYAPPSPERVRRFQRELQHHRVTVTVRRTLGQEIDAACGQLRRRFDRKGEPVAILRRDRRGFGSQSE